MTSDELKAANAICTFIQQQYWTGYYRRVMAMGERIKAEREEAAIMVGQLIRSFGPADVEILST